MSERERIYKQIEFKDVYTDENDEIYAIGTNVEKIRGRNNLTQKQVSEKMGYKSTSFISRLELWDAEKVTHKQVEKLAEALNVSVSDLLKQRVWDAPPEIHDDARTTPTNKYARQWNSPVVRFFYSKFFIIMFTVIFSIINLLLSLVFGVIYFIVSAVIAYILYKIFMNNRKDMLKHIEITESFK